MLRRGSRLLLAVLVDVATVGVAKVLRCGNILRPVRGDSLAGAFNIHSLQDLDRQIGFNLVFDLFVILAIGGSAALRPDIVERIGTAHFERHKMVELTGRIRRHAISLVGRLFPGAIGETIAKAFGGELLIAEDCGGRRGVVGARRALRIRKRVTIRSAAGLAGTAHLGGAEAGRLLRIDSCNGTRCAEIVLALAFGQERLLRVDCGAEE